MKQSVLVLMLTVTLIVCFGCAQKATNGQSLPPPPSAVKPRATAEEQWATFQKLGFELNPGIAKVEKWKLDKQFEEEPYVRLYQALDY